ncbi:hypothetical protein AXF42_Ash006505 [Apostasia shenzhenica]|uniref:DUF632 domain-containing protein n=1 Tax=Apostasia shenzhenica TaxID=1088818 RepID=A0A2I0AZ94_9ASPA|nr:hypothetical protein AXF42_Ash006505 [Apostasia shenzhenica]
MGCAQSRIENEEAVTRCKERRQFMKDAVASRNAFAAAHSAYVVALKNTGAALSDFGQGEAPDGGVSTASSGRSGPSGGGSGAASASGVQPPMENLPPPPPPLPDFSPSPLQRSVSMPDLPKKHRGKSPTGDAIGEVDDEVEEDLNEDRSGVGGGGTDSSTAAPVNSSPAPSPPPPPPSRVRPAPSPPPPPMPGTGGMGTWDYFFAMDDNMTMPGPSLSQPEEIRPEREEPASPPQPEDHHSGGDHGEEPPSTPDQAVIDPLATPQKTGKKKHAGAIHHQHAASTSAVEAKKGKVVAAASNVNLLQVLMDLDEHFLRASESAHEVSKMLEATRLHYHSNFADNRGHIDHSARVMRVITWNRSFKGLPYANDVKDDLDNDEWETHATVLDKMLAWEKKLYDEVKAGEIMKIEYQRKVALLNKQKKRGANLETIEKTKAAVSHLHTRYIVDMQSMDSTVAEIQHLRDNQLYPRLVDLVDGMEKMWNAMFQHHDSQLKVVVDLRTLDISTTPKETSDHHYGRTVQLFEVVKEWQSQFQKLVGHQKEYIKSLNSWLKLNLIPIESSLKEKVSSPPRVHQPPIQSLLYAWNDQLEKLPDDLAKSAISSFAAVIQTIMLLQQDELKLKEKCEETQKEYARKLRAFEDWSRKYSERRAAGDNVAENGEATVSRDPLAERKFVVDSLKTKLDDDVEAYQKTCKQVREKTLGSLKTHLPELFRAMSDFAVTSSDMYKKLKVISQARVGEASS